MRQQFDDLHSKQEYNYGFEASPAFSPGGSPTHPVFCNSAGFGFFLQPHGAGFPALDFYHPATLAAQPVGLAQPLRSLSCLIWEAAVSYEFRACFV